MTESRPDTIINQLVQTAINRLQQKVTETIALRRSNPAPEKLEMAEELIWIEARSLVSTYLDVMEWRGSSDGTATTAVQDALTAGLEQLSLSGSSYYMQAVSERLHGIMEYATSHPDRGFPSSPTTRLRRRSGSGGTDH